MNQDFYGGLEVHGLEHSALYPWALVHLSFDQGMRLLRILAILRLYGLQTIWIQEPGAHFLFDSKYAQYTLPRVFDTAPVLDESDQTTPRSDLIQVTDDGFRFRRTKTNNTIQTTLLPIPFLEDYTGQTLDGLDELQHHLAVQHALYESEDTPSDSRRFPCEMTLSFPHHGVAQYRLEDVILPPEPETS